MAPPPEPASDCAHYRERLWPSTSIWALAPGIGVGLGLVTTPLGPGVGVATAALTTVALALILAATSPLVGLDRGLLTAGRARIPVRVLGPCLPLDAAAMRRARGTGLDARTYLCLRGWIAQGVLVPVCDPADPTPSWLVSSRRPAALARDLNRARAEADRNPGDQPGPNSS